MGSFTSCTVLHAERNISVNLNVWSSPLCGGELLKASLSVQRKQNYLAECQRPEKTRSPFTSLEQGERESRKGGVWGSTGMWREL